MGFGFNTTFYYDINDKSKYISLDESLQWIMNDSGEFIDEKYLRDKYNIIDFCAHSRVLVTSWSSYSGPSSSLIKELKIRQT